MGAWVVLALSAALFVPQAQARTHHNEAWAREHFATAERMREALNGRPPADRTRHDYQKVVNAYRAVYLGSPASSKADPSVVAVAETLVEMGRRFDDDQILNKAIDQYKFLRREYPGSKYRFDGLFTIGEIYKDDLNNAAAARATFADFLHHYPRNRLADDAREAIAELDQQAQAQKNAGKATAQKSSSQKEKKSSDDAKTEVQAEAPAPMTETAEVRPEARSGKLPRVTAIRHWSTPNYTRVAIDVESEVKFSSQRIGTPSRIYFDLKDTKLASTLVGKSFDVEDGFLKKVRVAQFAPGRTRVVLEVENLADYNAFLLPNPYRLIIDIHGKEGRAKNLRVNPEEVVTDGPAENPEPNVVPDDVSGNSSLDANTEGTEAISHEHEEEGETSPSAKAATTAQTGVVKRVVVEADSDVSTASGPAKKRATRKATDASTKKNNKTDAKLDAAEVPVETADWSDPATIEHELSKGAVSHPAHGKTQAMRKADIAADLAIREAQPTSSGDRSLIRALGLKIGKIVIDPGHGGHDSGTVGPDGLQEKDLVLEVGRRLGKLLETRLGAEVVYTRKDDTFIPLETRTAIANQARADLFVSIHANSSRDPEARGVETYYLNFTSSPEALEVAARENAVSEKSIFELQDLVKKIAMKEKIEESREFAGDVQQSLHSGLAAKSPAIRDRGVKKAPFIVLIGANMPSILAEISFVSNPVDEHKLATSEYRERIAESLYRGIAKYANGLSGVKVASKMEKEAGQ
jgi:N-acetylmuramoyl-L-alanine amidase